MAAQDGPTGRKALLPISFFKIILKTNLQTLKIPKKFTERYGGGLSNPVFLKPRHGTVREVYWTKQNGEVWFQKGWKEFAENYSLDYGHLVVFKYKGTSHFDVLILDQSALEIHYPSCDQNLDYESDEEESDENLGEWKDQKPKQKSPLLSPQPHKKMRGGNSAGQRSSLSLNQPRGARAREVAESFISSKSNPFFTITISSHDLVQRTKGVPALEGYIENIDKYVKLKIGKKRSWDVKLIYRHTAIVRRILSAGWSLFARESELQPEDVCVFELISRKEEKPNFQVHVFKRRKARN